MKDLKTSDGLYDILIGESAKDNDDLITLAKKRDQNSWWFHLASVPSAHLVAFVPDPKVYLSEFKEHILSKTRKAPRNQSLLYTQIKYVKKTDVLGTVIPTRTSWKN